jgi:pyruvate/2-oxoglutarate dehydrogenase complex dihydrolipoamide acyltransferase (E2) component
MAYELTLTRLVPEMEYATVTSWLKREGETVRAGDPLLELEAEKANHEIEAPVSGVLSSIVAVEGDEVKLGDTLAVIEED